MRNMWVGLVAAVLVGCAPGGADIVEEDVADQGEDLATSISATLGPLKLTVQTKAVFEDRDGVRSLVIRGSANRNLVNVSSFVPDDPFGTATLLTARKFEIVLQSYEINTMLSGLPLLLSVETASGTPTSFVAQFKFESTFTKFTGSSKVFVEAPIDPVYLRTENPLRYRGEAHVTGGASALSVTTPEGASPVVAAVDADSFRFDWEYEGFAEAADPVSEKVTFIAATTSGNLTKKASIQPYVSGLAITTDDPYEVWPAVCDPAVWQCIQATPAGQIDLSSCGSYRDVQKCIHMDVCEMEGYEPLALDPIDATPVVDALAAYDAACANGGTWCSGDSASAFTIAECSETPFWIEEIAAIVNQASQDQPQGGWNGQVIDAASLASTPLFASTYSPTGPAFLDAIHAFTGSTEVVAWYAVEEVPCPNCHEFWSRAILFYPMTGHVVVVNGTHGYDS